MVYLAAGWLLGPNVANFLGPDPLANAALCEHLAEAALLISITVRIVAASIVAHGITAQSLVRRYLNGWI